MKTIYRNRNHDRPTFNRRDFARLCAVAAGGLAMAVSGQGQPAGRRRLMTIDLVGGSIGVSAPQTELMALAARHGFESVEPKPYDLAALDDARREAIQQTLRETNLVWGAAGLPVDFRGDEGRFRDDMEKLPRLMRALQQVGATRVGTWLSPCHDALTYLQNFHQHKRRLREVAKVLRDHGLRLGLEYVGTFSSRVRRRFPFVHSMAETAELIDALGTGHVGFILDSWHWWSADETADDILALRPEQIVAADLNDAPAGLPKREQLDNRRALPASTGVIDIRSFLGALQRIGYDGPVRAEPFSQELRDLDDEAACAATAQALRKALATLDGSEQ